MKSYFISQNSVRLQDTAAPARLLQQDAAALMDTLPANIPLNYGRYGSTQNGYLTVLTADAANKMRRLGYVVMAYRELPYTP